MASQGAGLYPMVYAVGRTLATSVLAISDALRGRLTVEQTDERLRAWSSGIVRAAQVQLEVIGRDQVPQGRACVFMSNHQSHFDVPILFVACGGTLRMVGKAELFRVPIFGPALRKSGFVSVDRSGDRAQAIAAMRECAEAIARGISIWIAPEGTRSPDGRLGAFKKGGFLLARDTGASIVPMAIDGSRDILEKHGKRVRAGVPVRVTFGAPIRTAGRPVEETMAEVRAFIAGTVTDPV